MISGNLQKKVASDEDVPSAPPFCSSAAEIKEVDERIPASRTANVQSMAEDCGLSTKADSNISSGINHQAKVPNHSDSPVRFVHEPVTKPKAISFPWALVPFFFESTILPEFQLISAYTCFSGRLLLLQKVEGRWVLIPLAFQLFMPGTFTVNTNKFTMYSYSSSIISGDFLSNTVHWAHGIGCSPMMRVFGSACMLGLGVA